MGRTNQSILRLKNVKTTHVRCFNSVNSIKSMLDNGNRFLSLDIVCYEITGSSNVELVSINVDEIMSFMEHISK